jgi:hypothetical protein
MAEPKGGYESYSGLKTDPHKELVLVNGVVSATIKGQKLALVIPMLVFANYKKKGEKHCSK